MMWTWRSMSVLLLLFCETEIVALAAKYFFWVYYY
jgi:hypothetical protein